MWPNDRQGTNRYKRQTNEQNSLVASNSFHESREANDNNSILVIGSFAHCLGQVTTDTLRTLINQHAQKPGVRSYREMVSELFYATGDAFAFVKMQSHDAAIRAKDGLNGMEIFGSDIQAEFVPNALLSNIRDNDFVDRQPSRASIIECKTDSNKQLSTSIEAKINKVSKEESTVEKDPWGRPTDGSWDNQDVGWGTYKPDDSWGGGGKSTTQSNFAEENVRSTVDKKDNRSFKSNNNYDFKPTQETVKNVEDDSFARPTEGNANGWGEVNNSWDNVINSNKTITNNLLNENDESNVGNQREYGRNSNNNNNNWKSNRGGFDSSTNNNNWNNDRPRGNDRGRGERGGNVRGRGGWTDRNSYPRNQYNSGDRDRNFSSRNDFNSGDRKSYRGAYNAGKGNFSSRENLNEDRIIEKKLSNTNVHKDRNYDNRHTNFEHRQVRPLFEPPSTYRDSGPIFRGRGRGGSFAGSGQQRNENESQQQFEGGRNENNQRNDETDGSDGHDEENKQQIGSPKKFGQLPKGVTSKDDPFEIKDDPAGERLDNPPSKVIYITNLPGEVNKSELFAMLFAKKLNIVDCDVFRYTRDHDDAGNAYSFAELGSEEEAKNAIELLNDTEFMNRKLLVMYSRKQTINMSTTMMREAKRRRNRGLGGDTSSVVSASNNNDGWDNGVNSLGGGSGDSWADFDDKPEEIGNENEIDTNLEINSEVFPEKSVCEKDDVTITLSEENVEETKICCVMVADEVESQHLEEMDDEVEISNLVNSMVENVANENGSSEKTCLSSAESLNENNEETKEDILPSDENNSTKLTKEGNTPFTSTESLIEKDNVINEDEETTTPFASIESLVEKVEEKEEESIN
uniref:RRM domain-containing protein n=1 Tax=Meloidogyne enterolobii TaxID=390850 RepID=A0A6V7VCF9_MELEN|nr:unnamed protein product [Meloidogyne enterolobii]